jgi:hypothetical protein
MVEPASGHLIWVGAPARLPWRIQGRVINDLVAIPPEALAMGFRHVQKSFAVRGRSRSFRRWQSTSRGG